ncbi:MAG: phosphoribosyltransferase [Pseudogulbenkiania sp.]|nr:phosphoribosyltransferase [Pseudogulbenkiania sp.]
MRFSDREQAATRLASQLAGYRGQHPLVLAIPRGAVPMAKLIADELQGELDVVLVRKLGAPFQPELAIGAIDESGWTYISEVATLTGASTAYIEREKLAQHELLLQRRQRYTGLAACADPAGRVVIVVDDGLATGATMITALRAIRMKHPAKLVCAVPVAPPDTLHKVSAYADEVVCLEAPLNFSAVGQFYEHFPQVSDEEVVDILQSQTL